MKSKIILGVIILCILAIGGTYIFANVSSGSEFQKQLSLGNKYLEEGKYEEAILAFNEAIEIEPKSVDARLGLADAYEALERYDEAEKVLKDAIDIDEDRPEPYIHLAELMIKQGRFKEALEVLEKGYSKTKNDEIKKMIDELKLTPSEVSLESGTAPKVVVQFKDTEFERLVREILGKQTGEIYESDLRNVTEINITGVITKETKGWRENSYMDMDGNEYNEMGKIKSVEDLKYFTNLTSLTLMYQRNISDYTPIKELKSLTHLRLRSNELKDISVLEGMTNLQRLELYDNQINNIQVIGSLSNLSRLGLGFNQINNIDVLSNLTKLEFLHIGGNNISDISALKGLKGLDYLELGGNNISDISALSGMTELTVLFLQSNNINNISALSQMKKLRILQLSHNQITDFSPVKGLNNLERIELDGDWDEDDFDIIDTYRQ